MREGGHKANCYLKYWKDREVNTGLLAFQSRGSQIETSTGTSAGYIMSGYQKKITKYTKRQRKKQHTI